MCKVLIIPSIKDDKRKETNRFIDEMSILMSKSNTDGLGYAAIDKDGKLFSERWLNNGHFGVRPNENDTTGIEDKKALADGVINTWGKALKTVGSTEARIWSYPTSKNYSRMGEGLIENDARAITLHTRMATCEKSLANVHPFISNDTSVIHNGVIQNSKQFDLKLSSCDSESILIAYLKANVGAAISSVSGMTDTLYGYYACGVFSRDSDGNRILDVFKGNNYNLSIAYIFELDTYVLASSDTDIRNACETLGFTHGGTKDIENDMITRINPYTGDVIGQESFKAQSSQWTDRTYTPPATVTNIDNVRRNVNRQLGKSPQYISMLKLTPHITMLSEREVAEFETTLQMGAY